MMQRAIFSVVCALLVCSAVADLYMHNPPGCNDRNRERSDNRNNANRIFNSQNNAKGGYAWRGDPVARASPDPLTYYVGSTLRLEWTNQHQCNSVYANTQCQLIIQYACNDLMPGIRDGYPDSDTVDASDNNNAGYVKREFNQNDGQNADGTNTISDNQFPGQRTARLNYYYNVATGNPGVQYGMHEGIDWYDLCRNTQRNKGLYHADQNLNNNDARSTRQNPNGDRHGLECPEERDYYPYWRPYIPDPNSVDTQGNQVNQPAAWFDVALLVTNPDSCQFYQDNSQNARGYGQCVCGASCRTNLGTTNNLIPWNQAQCQAANGQWVTQPSLGVDKPDCLQHDFGRDNHLGNTFAMNGGQAVTENSQQPETAHYLWTLPDRMAGKTCVVRMRYNISTGDYPNQAFNNAKISVPDLNSTYDCSGVTDNTARQGNPPPAAVLATIKPTKLGCYGIFNETTHPLFNRPYINVFGGTTSKLAIALNSDQSARTFQDRSYVFSVASRPDGVGSKTIWNLNVRGRRGNIVQCYPAVEYDFVPQKLQIGNGDFVHVQIHGSDFNAAKNANNGEGWQFSDRSNIVQVGDASSNFPLAVSQQTMFPSDNNNALAIRFALLDQQNCGNNYQNGVNNDQNDINNCGKLNSAPNRWPPNPQDGLVRLVNKGTFYYVSTRNNNFSNRSQKGVLIVGNPPGLTPAQQAGVALGAIAGVALVVGGVLFYGKKHPNTKAGVAYKKVAGCMSGMQSRVSGKMGTMGTTSTPGKTAAPMPDMEYQRA